MIKMYRYSYLLSISNRTLRSFNKHMSKNIVTASAVSNSASTEPKWQLVAAACIARSPIVSADLTEIEKQYKELTDKQEEELSLKSDHELRLIEDKFRSQVKDIKDEDIDLEDVVKQTAGELEDTAFEELKTFKFGSRTTEADASKEYSSLNRALDRALYLTINQKLGSQYSWVFPQTPWSPGETLRQSCERIVKDVCGPKVKVKILGNSPCGYFKYKYPKEIRRQGYIGAKLFFFSGYVLAFDSDGLEKSELFSEYLWLTQEELASKFGKSYYQAVSSFLISDQ